MYCFSNFQGIRTYWPKDQEGLVEQHFAGEIGRGKGPASQKCKELVKLFPHCNGDYRKLVAKVNNLIIKRKGRNKPVKAKPCVTNQPDVDEDDSSSSSDEESDASN